MSRLTSFVAVYTWNPSGQWTRQHQMSVNGKWDRFEREDLLALAKAADIGKARAEQMINRVIEVVGRRPDFAEEAGVNDEQIKKIQACHCTSL